MTDPQTEIYPTDGKGSEYYKVIALYAGFILVVLFQFPVAPVIQVISLILLFALLSVIGFIRKESEKDGLLYNHATFLSRTLWMWSFMLTIGVALAGYYFSTVVSMEELGTISNDLMSGNLGSPLVQKMLPIGLVGIAPSTLYILYRYILGLIYAIKGHFLPKPKNFF